MAPEPTYTPVTDDDVLTALQHEANLLEEELTTRNDLSPAEREVMLLRSEILREQIILPGDEKRRFFRK